MKIFKKIPTLLKLITIVAIVSTFLISCKKDKTNLIDSGPISGGPISVVFFANNNYVIDSSNSSANSYEVGCLFSATKNGKISRLGTKMPKAGTYRITLWDTTAAPKTPLAQAMVIQTKDAIATFSAITPVSIPAGKTYLVTIWMPATGKYFTVFKSGGGNIPYPITSGDITITGYRQTIAPQTPISYPTQVSLIGISGLADIEFQAN
jgi:hypothetical protein